MAQSQRVAFQVRSLKLAMETASDGARAMPVDGVPRELVLHALSLAFEHCLAAAERGQTPYEFLVELGDLERSRLTSWGDVLWQLVRMWLDEVWPRLQPGRAGGGSSSCKAGGAGQRGMCWSRRRRSRSRPTSHRSGGMNSAPLRPAI